MCCVHSGEMTSHEHWIHYLTVIGATLPFATPAGDEAKSRPQIFEVRFSTSQSIAQIRTVTPSLHSLPRGLLWCMGSSFLQCTMACKGRTDNDPLDPLRSFRLRIKTILSEWTSMKYPWISFWFLSSACGCHAACSFRVYCKLHVYSG